MRGRPISEAHTFMARRPKRRGKCVITYIPIVVDIIEFALHGAQSNVSLRPHKLQVGPYLRSRGHREKFHRNRYVMVKRLEAQPLGNAPITAAARAAEH